jgi:hypothetical protein
MNPVPHPEAMSFALLDPRRATLASRSAQFALSSHRAWCVSGLPTPIDQDQPEKEMN